MDIVIGVVMLTVSVLSVRDAALVPAAAAAGVGLVLLAWFQARG